MDQSHVSMTKGWSHRPKVINTFSDNNFQSSVSLELWAMFSLCRCPSGENWWYMGERCEKRGSTRDTVVIAASSTAAVFAVMLIITLVSVYCTRQRYREKTSSNTQDSTLQTVSWVWNLFMQNLLMKPLGEKSGPFWCCFSPLASLCFVCWNNWFVTVFFLLPV